MPSINRRNTAIILGLVLIVVVAIGVSRGPKKELVEEVDVSFSENELDILGESIESLEFEDLVGLSGSAIMEVEISEEDLDILGEAIEGLEFEDLGGLTEN